MYSRTGWQNLLHCTCYNETHLTVWFNLLDSFPINNDKVSHPILFSSFKQVMQQWHFFFFNCNYQLNTHSSTKWQRHVNVDWGDSRITVTSGFWSDTYKLMYMNIDGRGAILTDYSRAMFPGSCSVAQYVNVYTE